MEVEESRPEGRRASGRVVLPEPGKDSPQGRTVPGSVCREGLWHAGAAFTGAQTWPCAFPQPHG